jgi:hypothetical protein
MAFKPDQDLIETPSTPKFKADVEMYQEPTKGEKAKAFAYGAGTGLAGSLGELEKFGAYTVPEFLGLREEGTRENMGLGRETFFPTIKEAQQGLKKLGIERPREDVSGYETGGEIIGGFGTAIPGLVKGTAKGLLGVASRTSEKAARQAEQLGFKLSPAQVRQDIPTTAQGATGWAKDNQTLANKLSSKATGREATEINPEFVRERLNTLGGEFQNLYKDKVFNIDQDAVDALRQIANVENLLPPSVQVGAVKNTANNILEKFQTYSLRPDAIPGKFGVEGNQLQRIRTDLLQAARSSSSRQDAHAIYELVDAIDGSVARNHPQIAAKLDELRPLYRNTIILEDLVRNGGIRQGNISLESLGNMLGARKEGVRRVQGQLDQLGELGRELKLRARWQTVGDAATESTDILKKALGTALNTGAAALGLRSRYGRAVQRGLNETAPKDIPTGIRVPFTQREVVVKPGRAAKGAAAGTVTRPLNKNEEE